MLLINELNVPAHFSRGCKYTTNILIYKDFREFFQATAVKSAPPAGRNLRLLILKWSKIRVKDKLYYPLKAEEKPPDRHSRPFPRLSFKFMTISTRPVLCPVGTTRCHPGICLKCSEDRDGGFRAFLRPSDTPILRTILHLPLYHALPKSNRGQVLRQTLPSPPMLPSFRAPPGKCTDSVRILGTFPPANPRNPTHSVTLDILV